MMEYPRFARFLKRHKYLLAVVTLITIHTLHDGVYMVQVKLRYPKEYLAKLTNWMTVTLEMPDLEDEDPALSRRLGLCPKTPPNISTTVHPANDSLQNLSALTKRFIPYRPGGHFRPQGCVSRTKTAVIIPYRDRERHLAVLLNHLIPFLFRQQAEFAIFVVEPEKGIQFNRALLLNVGFLEALKTNNFTCFVFHDVDRIPECDYNLYRCGRTPRHMMVAPSEFGYSLPYRAFGGGVFAMSTDIYRDINGHSNLFFGWGGEDDDLLSRLTWKEYEISRYPVDIGRYSTILHKRDKGNPASNTRHQLRWTSEKRMPTEGLSSLRYRVVHLEKKPLYTWVLIDIDIDYYNHAIAEYT